MEIDMKDKKYKIAVIGGDARQLIVGAELVAAGHEVALYGFGGEVQGRMPVVDSLCCSHPSVAVREILSTAADGGALDCGEMASTVIEAVRGSLAVILPLPSAADGNTVSMPLGGAPLKFTTLAEIMAQSGVKYACGGKLPADFAALCTERGIGTFDYYESDAFSIANAIPSAEGAIEIAMRELPITLNGANALVIGYGRIGKVLSRLLARLGASVTASARKPSDIAWVRADGYIPATIAMEKLYKKIGDGAYRDGSHVSYGIGRYTLGLLWYGVLFDKDVCGIGYRDFDVEMSDEEIEIAERCASETLAEFTYEKA